MSEIKPTIAEMRKRMNTSFEELLTLIDTYSTEQMITPTDAAGWTVRDHLTHMVAWAEGVAALLRREPRWPAMGLTDEQAEAHDLDAMNDIIFKQNQHNTPTAARANLVAAHNNVITAMEALTDDDLLLPYDRYIPPFTGDEGHPIFAYIMGNTAGHYQEHMPWIKAIIAGE